MPILKRNDRFTYYGTWSYYLDGSPNLLLVVRYRERGLLSLADSGSVLGSFNSRAAAEKAIEHDIRERHGT